MIFFFYTWLDLCIGCTTLRPSCLSPRLDDGQEPPGGHKKIRMDYDGDKNPGRGSWRWRGGWCTLPTLTCLGSGTSGTSFKFDILALAVPINMYLKDYKNSESVFYCMNHLAWFFLHLVKNFLDLHNWQFWIKWVHKTFRNNYIFPFFHSFTVAVSFEGE